MELYHGSNIENLKITEESDLFGEFLFFSADESAAASHGENVYAMEIAEDDIISPYEMFYMWDYEGDEWEKLSEVIQHVSKVCEVDEDEASDLLAEQSIIDGELGWFIQKQIGICSKILGYDCVSVRDEHGTSYMINMINKNFENK